MIMCVGKSASDISLETQMILLEAEQEFVLSIVDEDTSEELTRKDKAFRKTLQGIPSSVFQFCYESGEIGRMYEPNVDDLGYKLVAIYTPVRDDGVGGQPVSASTDPIVALFDKDRSPKKATWNGKS